MESFQTDRNYLENIALSVFFWENAAGLVMRVIHLYGRN